MPGLYIHIPFCEKKCHYCNFVITTECSHSVREQFLTALSQEIKQAAKQYGRVGFETLYLGGGTPSVLSASEISRLLELVREAFDFKENIEFTCEVNPGDVTAEKLKAYHSLGVNRISIGAQAFQDSLLQAMNRTHDVKAIFETMKQIHAFKNISFDLISRLPHQSIQDWKESLQAAIELKPTQIVIYELEVHSGTVYGKRHEEGHLGLPPEEKHIEMAQLADEMLERGGYEHYELMTYAKPGYESKHNLLYWRNQEYLGLGPGAFSYMKGVRYQFARDVRRYFEKCRAEDWTKDTEDKLTLEQKAMETVLTGLRLKEGACFKALTEIRPQTQEVVESLMDEGLLEKKGSEGRFALTQKGRFVSESVFAQLMV